MAKLIVAPENEIQQLISRAVENALKDALPRVLREAHTKPVYTTDEVCQLFGVSRRHLQYLRDTEQINYVQNGRKVLFRADDLESFFQAHYVQNKNKFNE